MNKKQDVAGDAKAKPKPVAGDGEAKPKPKGPLLKTTMLAGLGVDAFIKPHALTDDEVLWMLSGRRNTY